MEEKPIPLTTEKGIGGYMKKITMILLSVMVLAAGGCGSSTEYISDEIAMRDTDDGSIYTPQADKKAVTKSVAAAIEAAVSSAAAVVPIPAEADEGTSEAETMVTELPQTPHEAAPTPKPAEVKREEPAKVQTDNKTQNGRTEQAVADNSLELETKSEPQAASEAQAVSEPQPVQEYTQPQITEYSPYDVAALATAKTKAYGKISIPEDLDRLLAEGQITKEMHDAAYPYDGCGYYSVYVETDLNHAKTMSGRTLGSVDEIAGHIADMMALESGSYFYIEYAGSCNRGGTDFYEFRCYR